VEDWIIGMTLALIIIISSWLALSRRKQVEKKVEAWSELAQRTGLTYGPGYSVRGEYRSRVLRQTLESEVIGPPWTLISLNVKNNTGFSLAIQVMRIFNHGSQIPEISSGNPDFNNRFRVTGLPWEFVRASGDLIVHSDPHLLAWMMRIDCSIKLDGENLLWSQNSELTDVDDQFALLNLLCDIAELAERMGNEATSLTAGTG